MLGRTGATLLWLRGPRRREPVSRAVHGREAEPVRRRRLRRHGRRRDDRRHRGARRAEGRAARARAAPRRHGLGRPRLDRLRQQGGDRRLRRSSSSSASAGSTAATIEWHFEPHVAEEVFADLVKEAGVTRVPRSAPAREERGREVRHAGQRDRHGERRPVQRDDLRRRELRGRPDGPGGRQLHLGPRGDRRRSTNRSPASASRRRCTSSAPRSLRTTPSGRLLPEVMPRTAGSGRRRGQARPGLQLPPLHDANARPTACRSRSRAATTRHATSCWRATCPPFEQALGRPLAINDVMKAGPPAERQDRHQQQRRLLDRLHRRQLRLSRGQLRRARADPAGARRLHPGLSLLPRHRPARARRRCRPR